MVSAPESPAENGLVAVVALTEFATTDYCVDDPGNISDSWFSGPGGCTFGAF
jgi:hypothetical protein